MFLLTFEFYIGHKHAGFLYRLFFNEESASEGSHSIRSQEGFNMKVGCFALVDPFQTLDHQLERIAGLGFSCADVTDNHPGGSLGREFGFAATVSLDDNTADVKRLFAKMV